MTNLENIKCYHHADYADCYTAVLLDMPTRDGLFECLSADANPYHPCGIGMHSTCTDGKHLGITVAFDELPEKTRKFFVENAINQLADGNA